MIQIAAREAGNAWEITVRDTGIGIPPALQPTIFGVFQRLRSGKTLHPGGIGVGLALVARIAETYGGTVWVESGEGMGSTFHLRLPHHEHDRRTTVLGYAVGGNERGHRGDEIPVACASTSMTDGGTHDVDHW